MSRFDTTVFQPSDLKPGLTYSEELVVFLAKEVVTHDDAVPFADAVAVQHGKIIAVGERTLIENALTARSRDYRVDGRFAEAVIYPGFIEAHMHPQISGALHKFEYVGAFDRHRPDGSKLPGCKTRVGLLALLKELVDAHRAAHGTAWFSAWGLDPLVLDDRTTIDRYTLDAIATDLPIAIMHMSGHLLSVNTLALEMSGVAALDHSGVFRDENGVPTGVLAEPDVTCHVFEQGALCFAKDEADLDKATEDIARIASHNGCTTIGEKALGIPMIRYGLDAYLRASRNADFPVRLSLEPWFTTITKQGAMGPAYYGLKEAVDNDRITIGNMKFLFDGSIQGFTANLLDEHYYNGRPSGELLLNDDKARALLEEAHRAGISCSIHTNGNGATEQALRVLEAIQADFPRADIHHTLEHSQLATEEQLWRMKRIGVKPNFFINHIHFWGDIHASETVGPDAVKRQNPLRSAQRHGLIFGIHSDDWVTEVNPLLSAWVAANRKSASGKVLGEDQCLTVDEAMRLITLGNAAMLGQAHIKGSVTPGKLADFTVLAEKACEANRETFRDIPVLATVVGGKVFELR